MVVELLLLVLSLQWIVRDGADAAGMATHTMVGTRVTKYFGNVSATVRCGSANENDVAARASLYNHVLQKYPDVAISGSDFPDFLYIFHDSRHDRAEEAHWPPWQKAAVEYIRAIPQFQNATEIADLDEDTAKLVAFVFGVSIHFAADEFWEGLTDQIGRGQGFTAFVGQFNLGDDGMGNDDEGTSNMATDFFMPYFVGKGDVNPWERYFPLKHVVGIYGVLNETVDLSDLEESRVIFDLGLWAENTFGSLLSHAYSELYAHVPVVAERVIEMPVGGLDDMAFWASNVWQRIACWLDQGPPENPPPRRRRRRQRRQMRDDDTRTADDGESDILQATFIHSMTPFIKYAEALRSVKNPLLQFLDHRDPSKGMRFDDATCNAENDRDLCDAYVEIFKTTAEAMFRSQRMRQEVVPSLTAWWNTIETTSSTIAHDDDSAKDVSSTKKTAAPSQTMQGRRPLSYLGRSLTVGDFDGDGIEDIAIGAPGDGRPGRIQVGAVQVQYGKDNRTKWIEGPVVHGRFGFQTTTIDFNADGIDDLVVAAPLASWENETISIVPFDSEIHVRYWGRVYVYFGSRGEGLSDIPDVEIKTDDDLTMAGIYLHAVDVNGDERDDLIIGAPYSSYKIDSNVPDVDSIHVGGVYVFFASSSLSSTRKVNHDRDTLKRTYDLRADANVVIEGPAGYDEFGYAVDVVRNNNASFLLVGAPGHRTKRVNASSSSTTITTVGAMYGYNISDTSSPHLVFIVEGRDSISEFGSQITVRRHGDDTVAISAPSAGSSSFLSDHLRAGDVFLVSLQSVLNTASESRTVFGIDDVTPIATISANERLSRFGTVAQWLYNGTMLVISAPLRTESPVPVLTKSRERGAVYVWNTTDSVPQGHIANLAESSTHQLYGTADRGRFGMSVAAYGPNGLVVGSPYASSSSLEMRGQAEVRSLIA